MRLARVSRGSETAEGIIEGDGVRIIGGWQSGPPDGGLFTLPGRMADLAHLLNASAEMVPLDLLSLEKPLSVGAKIICAGLNYRDHVAEANAEPTEEPAVFLKDASALVAHGDALHMPACSDAYDYEGEIAVVIGRPCRNISIEEALTSVCGFTCFMDGSVRDFQTHSISAGKNFWRSGSIGPWITTLDDIDDLASMTLTTRINGELRQSTSVGHMIFSIPRLIAYCSRWTQLMPGDVIATGTPAGVGAASRPPIWLRSGDEVEVSVGGVGSLRNRVAGDSLSGHGRDDSAT